MIDVRNLLRNYSKVFNNDTVRHVLLNWSESEQCIRHPSGPIGWIIRDQGQLHLYAGKCHSILSMDGSFLNIATKYALVTESANITTRGINNFRILGKHFNKKLHDGQTILSVIPKTNISSLSVIGPETKVIVNGQIGDIINAIPIPKVFDVLQIFEQDPNDENLIHPDVEVFNLIKGIMAGK